MLIHQRGVTLVELMIAGATGLIAVAAVTTIYQATAKQTLRQLETLHLHNTLQGILELMGTDIRRSGYWRVIPGREKLRHNPFQTSVYDIQTGAMKNEPAASCISLSYDLDKDGKVGIGQCPGAGCPPTTDADNVELFGFRLNRQALQMRYAGTAPGCQNGFWQALTDHSITVSNFRVDLQQQCLNLSDPAQPCHNNTDRLLVRTAEISLSAYISGRKPIRADLRRVIPVRNDRFVAAGNTL